VSNGFALGMESVAARVGLPAAQALYRLSCFGTEYVRREIAEGDPSIKMGEGWQGCIRYSNAAKKRPPPRRWPGIMARRSSSSTWPKRGRGRTAALLPVDLRSIAFHMHPLRYALMIAGKAEAEGCAAFREFAGARRRCEGAAHVVRTAEGEVRAKRRGLLRLLARPARCIR
jgi:gamma-glutamylputrescine oxidase